MHPLQVLTPLVSVRQECRTADESMNGRRQFICCSKAILLVTFRRKKLNGNCGNRS